MSFSDKSMISGLLIDFGGTLDSDGGHWLERFWKLYAQSGLSHIPKERIREAFDAADLRATEDAAMQTAGFRQMINFHIGWQFEKLGISDHAIQTSIAEAFYRPSERILHRNRIILEKLAEEGVKMAVISNSYGNMQTLCDEAGLSPSFKAILDSHVLGVRKPDPAIFLKGLEALDLPASRVAFVGDSFERDMVPAKKLGMKTIWLIGDSRKEPPQPGVVDHVLHSLEDLPSLVMPESRKPASMDGSRLTDRRDDDI